MLRRQITIFTIIFLLLVVTLHAGSWGPAIEQGAVLCTDDIDNDGDLLIDAFDSDCDLVFYGKVFDYSGSPISGAQIEARTGSYYKTTYTNSSGDYIINVVTGEYDLVASAVGYAPSIVKLFGDYSEFIEQNFTLSITDSTCKSDCTRGTANGNVCDKTCDGYNSCSFGTLQVMNACDPGNLAYDGYQKNVVVPVPSTSKTVKCCKGTPKAKAGSSLTADLKVTSKSKNIVTIKRVVILNGQPVTMVIAVFD